MTEQEFDKKIRQMVLKYGKDGVLELETSGGDPYSYSVLGDGQLLVVGDPLEKGNEPWDAADYGRAFKMAVVGVIIRRNTGGNRTRRGLFSLFRRFLHKGDRGR